MKLTRRSAMFLILVCAGIPLSVFPAIIVFFGFQGHERLLENTLESILGVGVDVKGFESLNVDF